RRWRGSRCVRWCPSLLLLLALSSEMDVEAIEASLGGKSLAVDPLGRGAQGVRRELIRADAADLRRLDDPGAFQHAKVLDDGGQRHVERSGQLRDGCRSVCETLDHGTAVVVSESMEDQSEWMRRGILRYKPKYYDRSDLGSSGDCSAVHQVGRT